MLAKPNAEKRPGFLRRLRRDQSGNTVAMMAAGLIPLTAMIGSGVDVSRVYLVKTRLQQACDAGALAGRKRMAGDAWNANSNAARNTALAMFDANFGAGTTGSVSLTRGYSEAGGTVTGTASVDVPMVLMQMFGKEKSSVSVTCDAELAIPNTDVMFVVDTTGSMNCPDNGSFCPGGNNNDDEVSNSKIVGLRKATRCFYETLFKKDTEADCGSTPSGVTQTAQIRFGFVPYTSNVNVGKLLPQEYMADNWTYQSRVALKRTENVLVGYSAGTPFVYDTITVNGSGNWSSYSTHQNISNVKNSDDCNNLDPASYNTFTGTQGSAYDYSEEIVNGNQQAEWKTDEAGTRHDFRVTYTKNTKICKVEKRTRRVKNVRSYRRVDEPVYEAQLVFDKYEYRPVSYNISGLKDADGVNWNTTVTLPVGIEGQDSAVGWDGCIEERQTVRATDFDPIPVGANDLDVDLIPDGSVATQWAPVLRDAVWARYIVSYSNGNPYTNEQYGTVTTTNDLGRNMSYSCPVEAAKLQVWADPAVPDGFDDYVSDLQAYGSTYHDIGLIWGARLLSPTGMFAAENTNKQNIQRHLIFMTDGDTSTGSLNYSSYGVEWYDRRRTSTSSAPSTTTLNGQVNSRFLAMCEYIKTEMRITLWVVSFGATVSDDAKENMETCASTGKYKDASTNASLLTEFKAIASEISDLRLTK